MAGDDPFGFNERDAREKKVREEIKSVAVKVASRLNVFDASRAVFDSVRAGGKLGFSYVEKGIVAASGAGSEQDATVLRGIDLYSSPGKKGDCNEFAYLYSMMLRDAAPPGLAGVFLLEATGAVKISDDGRVPPFIDSHVAVAVFVRGSVPDAFAGDVYVRFEKSSPHHDAAFRSETLARLGLKDSGDLHVVLIDPSTTSRARNFGVQYDRVVVWSDVDSKANFLSERGSYELKKGLKEKARASFKASISVRDNSDARDGLAQIFFSEGNFSAAAREFEAALALNPRDFLAASNLAVLESDKGNFSKAIQLREQTIRFNDNPLTRFQLGFAYFKNNRVDDAEQSLRIAASGFKNSKLPKWEARARAGLGDVHAARGDLAAAISEYEKAATLSSSPNYNATLGLMLIARGGRSDLSKATGLFKQAIGESPAMRETVVQRLHAMNTPLASEAIGQLQEKRVPLPH